MPIGSYASVPWVAQHLITHRPQRILDLGMGFGMYGAMVRQWLDLGVQPWKTFLVGVEGWVNYRNPVWDLYNVVYAELIQDFLKRESPPFDCVILGDVIEHLPKDEGRQLIVELQRLVSASGHLLIVTPAEFFEQGAVYGNALEVHRSHWQPEDFTDCGFQVPVSTDVVIACWTPPPASQGTQLSPSSASLTSHATPYEKLSGHVDTPFSPYAGR